MSIIRKVAVLLSLTLVIGTLWGCGASTNSEAQDKRAVINVIDMTLTDAEAALNNAGFTNITSNVDSNADKTNWIVIEQSIEAGKSIKPEDVINLTCALKCMLYLDVTSENNLLLSKYDITISLDGKELGTVANGNEFTRLADVLSGDHELMFCKTGDTGLKCVKTISISGDMTYTCDLAHGGSSIDIKNENMKEGVEGSALEVVDVTGMVLSEAIETLNEIGFSNIHEEPHGDIWDKNNWIVMAQNIDAGTVTDKTEYIQLDCISLNDYFNDTYVGKNVAEIQDLADKNGFNLRFVVGSGNVINDRISLMDQETKKDWIASEARQYSSEKKTAVVTVSYTGEAAESNEPAKQESTSKPEENTPVEKDIEEPDTSTESEKEMYVLNASDLRINLMTDYGHYDDSIYLGNDEGLTVTITIDKNDVLSDDLFFYDEDSLLNVEVSEPNYVDNKTRITAYVTADEECEAELLIGTVYELMTRGEKASVYSYSIRKLDSEEGRVVYVTPTGSKYHFDPDCAGENATPTTYYDVEIMELEPCGKCAD